MRKVALALGFCRFRLRFATMSFLLGGVALAQQPDTRPTETDDPAVAAQRIDELVAEAKALTGKGDMEAARAACQRALASARLDSASDAWLAVVAESLWRLGYAAHRCSDLHAAHDAWEAAVRHRAKTLPDEHPDLQRARLNVAVTKRALGDLAGALALFERVFVVFSKTLPDEHPDLQLARQNLALTKRELGDLASALALEEKVFAVRSRTLPDEHPILQRARFNLAATKYELGDLAGALALFETVFAVFSKTLPDEHPDLQLARQGLAVTKRALGDLAGARALLEKVFAVRSRSLPDEPPDLQAARMNLAVTRHELGDLEGALVLEEKVFKVRSKTLPDGHPDLQLARQNLALTKKALGDFAGALALLEKVFAVRSKTLPDEHPDLQLARQNLAGTKRALGDLAGALVLFEKVFAVRSKTLPDEHPDLQRARLNLASTRQALGDLAAAARLYDAALAGAVRRLSSSIVSVRVAAQLAFTATKPLSYIGNLLDSSAIAGPAHAVPRELAGTLTRDGLGLLTAARSAEGRTTALLRRLLREHPDEFERSGSEIARANKALDDAIALPREGRVGADGRQVLRDDAIRKATLAKDAAERALAELVPEAMRVTPTANVVASGLGEHEAAIAFLTYSRFANDPEKPWPPTAEKRFAAFVLTPSGQVTWHSLAPVTEVEPLIASVRQLSMASARSSSTERGPRLGDQLAALRSRLFDPLLGSLPAGTESLVVSLADELLLAPIEQLPMADGRSLGDALQVQIVPSLRSLLDERIEPGTDRTLLALGSVDYDAAPETPAPVQLDVATPIVAAAPNVGLRSPDRGPGENATPKSFPPLFNTEAQNVGKLFAWAIEDATLTTLLEAQASEAAFVTDAPGKTFLHLATHGYFAPESAWNATDAPDTGPLAHFDVGRQDRVAQLSPFSLTGIALAGANLEPDELGRREGILTAQEIAGLDLTSCYLATLSACNTSLGVRRGGTGLASLRQAFHAAGVRFVLATLWEVNYMQAERLMTDFYTRLWKKGEDPRTALRAAQEAARQRGAPFGDWAGWVISGR
ncbi:MAG: CHAT domain-containing protein [Planctomycetes bacterium]|nr:CHAT domain-containing protein [Planctomycetota bacterium]